MCAQNLEKTPLEDVAPEPAELLDRNRYQRSSRDLGPEKEARVADIVARISEICGKRGVLIKPFFDDAAQDDHSAKLYGHVTIPQFKQCLNVKVGQRCLPCSEILGLGVCSLNWLSTTRHMLLSQFGTSTCHDNAGIPVAA